MDLFFLFLGVVLVNNFILAQFLGVCSFFGVSNKIENSIGMSLAVTFVITLSAFFTHITYRYILVPLQVEYLSTMAYILIIASLVQLVEMFIKKSSPALHRALGVYLPLIAVNCAIFGVAIINQENNHTLLQSVVFGFGAGVGFSIAILLLAGLRTKLEKADIPKIFRGYPITFIIAGLMSIAFMGFNGLF